MIVLKGQHGYSQGKKREVLRRRKGKEQTWRKQITRFTTNNPTTNTITTEQGRG